MELQYYGANCVRISTKNANIVIDDNLSSVGLKAITKEGDIALFTQRILEEANDKQPKIVINQPGEYEVSTVAIIGIAARAHMEEDAKQNATMYKIVASDLRIVVAGHIYPELSDKQLEELGTVDVLIIPVGGNGYTLDALGALKIIKAIEPKIVIPTHYADNKVAYEVPAAALADVLQTMGVEVAQAVSKLKLKSTEIPETMQIVELERQ